MQKDGVTPAKWLDATLQKRVELGVTRSERPFTTRSDIRMRGLPEQTVQPNFLHEVLDLRVLNIQKKRGAPWDAPIPKHLLVDARQSANFQNALGSVSLLARSRVFTYHYDRCLVGGEHMQLQGWSLADTNAQCVVHPARQEIQAQVAGTAPKKRKGKTPEVGIKLVEMAGNAQSLADLSLFTIPTIYVLNNIGIFGDNLAPDQLIGLFGDVHAPARILELDPNMSQAGFRALQRSFGDEFASDTDKEDRDKEDGSD